MTARTDLRAKRRRAKRQREWEARRRRLVWIDLSDVRLGDPPGTIGRVIGPAPGTQRFLREARDRWRASFSQPFRACRVEVEAAEDFSSAGHARIQPSGKHWPASHFEGYLPATQPETPRD